MANDDSNANDPTTDTSKNWSLIIQCDSLDGLSNDLRDVVKQSSIKYFHTHKAAATKAIESVQKLEDKPLSKKALKKKMKATIEQHKKELNDGYDREYKGMCKKLDALPLDDSNRLVKAWINTLVEMKEYLKKGQEGFFEALASVMYLLPAAWEGLKVACEKVGEFFTEAWNAIQEFFECFGDEEAS